MKAFYCTCGWRVFFENTQCLGCDRRLGFDPQLGSVVALEPAEGDVYPSASMVRPRRYRLCRNYCDHQVCNWLVSADAPHDYCLACGLNEVIPSLAHPKNHLWWRNMEAAKRRLLYTLLRLKLPVLSKQDDPQKGLAFAFLQDRRHNPAVEHDMVLTGHSEGLITVNVMEADDAARESQRVDLNESYRTLLGHFRHESGHYYWQQVVKNNGLLNEFRGLFGDEREHYGKSLSCYYVQAGDNNWHADYISAYARAHPWEDWAETWAHYLHMVDALETARVFSVTKAGPDKDKFQHCLSEWAGVMVMLNELNRSVGQYDAYPFFLSERIANKLHFVHRTIQAPQTGNSLPPSAGSGPVSPTAAERRLVRPAPKRSFATAVTCLCRERFQEGVADFLTVLDAKRRMLEDQDRLAPSETATATTTTLVAVYKALGAVGSTLGPRRDRNGSSRRVDGNVGENS